MSDFISVERDAHATLERVNEQIELADAFAKAMGISPYEVRNDRGEFIFVGLLQAKVMALHTCVMLEQIREDYKR